MRYINVKLETVAMNEKHANIMMNGETLVEFAEDDENEHLLVRLLWVFTYTYELMLKKKAILHIAFFGHRTRSSLLLIECGKSFVDICGRTASPLHALPYTVRKATESVGAAMTAKRPAAMNDQKAIPKRCSFCDSIKIKESASGAANVEPQVAMITFTSFVKIALISLACPNKPGSADLQRQFC
ncbi:hypothetical protein T01_7819 [Trichinella spiralis]|uniref:Uncharacterized protein n=1 Tax=Trichinella spiralis TaxID=6334 RepID=A0A0V1BQD0_TRISP|nr:hypothetical protein T01_7819 [Trichinella spiralis]